jgi:hypothetical protein
LFFCLLPGDFSLSHLFLQSLFLHALVIVNSRTCHTSDKNPFIISHVCGGTWRMTHCLHAFIVNITPEAKVLLKYHSCQYSPLFSLTKSTKYNFCDVFYATVGFAQNRDSVAMVSNSPYTIGLLFGVPRQSSFFWKPEV